MSTSEECSQLYQGLLNSVETIEQDSILSKEEEQIPNNLVVSDNVNSPFIDPVSANEIVTTQQSDTLNSTISFQESNLHNNSRASLDTTPDAHTIDLPPSSPDTLSQDSQSIEENGRDIEVLTIYIVYITSHSVSVA